MKDKYCKRGHEKTPENTIVVATGAHLCKACKTARDKRTAAERYQRLKAEMHAAYGGECAHCETTERLQLDHVNGDGYAHRLALTGRERTSASTAFYKALKARGWPNNPPIQLLCTLCHKEKTADEQRDRPRKEWEKSLGVEFA